MLYLEPLLIAAIKTEFPGFKTVGNPSVLAGLRDIVPLLPACIVSPGGAEPKKPTTDPVPVLEEQDWDIVVIVPHQLDQASNGLTETIAGAFMDSIFKLLQGQKLSPEQRLGFMYKGRDVPAFNDGYAEFPMTFGTNTMIGK